MTCNCMSWTLNQPEIVVQQALTGTFADGLGKVQHVPDRVSFAPMPWGSFANDVDYATIARQVYLATDARVATRDAGMEVPKASGRTIVVMGSHSTRPSRRATSTPSPYGGADAQAQPQRTGRDPFPPASRIVPERVASKWPRWDKAKLAAHCQRYIDLVHLTGSESKKPAQLGSPAPGRCPWVIMKVV
jgi:hypothetical protein